MDKPHTEEGKAIVGHWSLLDKPSTMIPCGGLAFTDLLTKVLQYHAPTTNCITNPYQISVCGSSHKRSVGELETAASSVKSAATRGLSAS